MVFTFVGSFLLILFLSFYMFFYYMNFELDNSVEGIFYSHIYQIMQDIIKLKKNDFILSLNEL